MSRTIMRGAGLPLAALLALAACEEGPTRPEDRSPGGLAASVVYGNDQAGTAGSALADTVVVRVTDGSGSPVRDLPLEWRVLSGEGELRSASTVTGRDGRSANLWVLGPRAGAQEVEVRALLSGGPAVLDTVRATAEAGPAVELRLLGDSVRSLVVGDTTRLAVEGRDRFGNPVPAAALRAEWRSLHPSVAAADSGGLVRVLGMGEATVEVTAGTARTRAHLRADAASELYPVPWTGHYPYIVRMYQDGGRLLAVGVEYYRVSAYALVLSFDGSGWRNVWNAAATESPDLFISPVGTAYVPGAFSTGVSERGGSWRSDSLVAGWKGVAGAGGAVFGHYREGYPTRRGVQRLSGGTLTDLGLPAPYAGRPVTALAAAGESELYLATETETLHWNGSGWALVPPGAGLGFRTMAAPPGGGTVYGVLGRSALYTLRGGRAERTSNPLEDRGETVVSLAVDRDGNPYLLGRDRLVYRAAGVWREYRIAGEWGGPTAVWPDADGSVWVSVYRPTGEMTYYGEKHDLAFLRIRVRAP